MSTKNFKSHLDQILDEKEISGLEKEAQAEYETLRDSQKDAEEMEIIGNIHEKSELLK